jgi:tetratricopeptide (TPR) repeat protein
VRTATSLSYLRIGLACSVIVLASQLPTALRAQQLPAFYEAQATYFDALSLFQKESYAAAYEKFRTYLGETGQDDQAPQLQQPAASLLLSDARFYEALCSFYLLRSNTELLFTRFLQDYPLHAKSTLAHFYKAKLLFIKRYYSQVYPELEQMNWQQLDEAQQAEASFMQGFSYLDASKLDQAAQALYPLTQQLGPWHDQANYYLAIVYYRQQQYAEAFRLLQAIEQAPSYQAKVPLYIAGSLVALGQYPLAEDYADKLQARRLEWEQKPLLYRELGTAIYENGHLQKALPYLSHYAEAAPSPQDRASLFRLGHCHYAAQQYTAATRVLEPLLAGQDSLASAASYYLGFCYLQLERREEARLAFQTAYAARLTTPFTADALFEYGKLSLATQYYTAAEQALRSYLASYPTAPHTEEANQLLGEVLYYGGSFAEAVPYFEKSPIQNIRTRKTYQRVCYYHGLSLLEKGSAREATAFLEKAVQASADADFTQRARFWLGEALFYQKQYEPAQRSYQQFVHSTGASGMAYYPQALLGLGWCQLRRQAYAEAARTFQGLQQVHRLAQLQPQLYREAVVRRADALFLQKQYKDANFLYAQLADSTGYLADYALYQYALCQSRMEQHKRAIAKLELFLKKHPNSPLNPEALYALSEEYLSWEHNASQARAYANRILSSYPGSGFAARAHVLIAQANLNLGQEPEAIDHYRTVLAQYGNEEEPVRTAFAELKHLLGPSQIDSLLTAYEKQYPGGQTFLDDASFAAARDLLLIDQQYQAGVARLSRFIRQYPNSQHLNEALLLRGEGYQQLDSTSLALADYEALFAQSRVPPELLTRAQLQAAYLYLATDAGRSAELYSLAARQAANKIDSAQALIGWAEAQVRLGQPKEARAVLNNIYGMRVLPAYTRAKTGLILAKLEDQLGDSAQALKLYEDVSRLEAGALRAEALYYTLELHYRQGAYTRLRDSLYAQKALLRNQDYWQAKAYLLLANAFWQLEQHQQALETLRSIALHAQDPGLKTQASQLLETRTKALEALQAENAARLQEKAAAEKAKLLKEERADPVEEVSPKDPRLDEAKPRK